MVTPTPLYKPRTLVSEQILAQLFSDQFPTEYLSADNVIITPGNEFMLDVGALLRAQHEATSSIQHPRQIL